LSSSSVNKEYLDNNNLSNTKYVDSDGNQDHNNSSYSNKITEDKTNYKHT